MKALVYHLQVNVSNAKESLPFYKGLLKYFDYKIIDESEEHLGASNKTTDFWIIQTERKYAKPYHRKSTGINHIAFKVSKKEDVDKFGLKEDQLVMDAEDIGGETNAQLVPYSEIQKVMEEVDHLQFF